MCLKCVGKCPANAETAFRASIAAQLGQVNGQVNGEYINSTEKVQCICAQGHVCYPIPSSIQQGHGMCLKCARLCPEETEEAFKANITALGG